MRIPNTAQTFLKHEFKESLEKVKERSARDNEAETDSSDDELAHDVDADGVYDQRDDFMQLHALENVNRVGADFDDVYHEVCGTDDTNYDWESDRIELNMGPNEIRAGTEFVETNKKIFNMPNVQSVHHEPIDISTLNVDQRRAFDYITESMCDPSKQILANISGAAGAGKHF